MISKQVLHRKGIFLVESQTCLESSLLQGTREDCHVKRTRALVENLEKKNNKRFKDPVLWTWQEILDINSKTTYYLLSCRLGSIPAKAYCVLFESQHSKWYHKRLFNEHPRSLYMEPPPLGGGGASIHLSTNLHEKHIAIHRISRMDNEGMFHHLATPSWLEINIITILTKIKRRTNIQQHTSV